MLIFQDIYVVYQQTLSSLKPKVIFKTMVSTTWFIGLFLVFVHGFSLVVVVEAY